MQASDNKGPSSSEVAEHKNETIRYEESKLEQQNVANGDVAVRILHSHFEPHTKEEERRLLRKIDLRLASLMLVVNGIQFMDKLTISTFAAARFFLGVYESCLNPGFILITSSWWKREEQPARIAIWYSANGLVSIPTGFIFYAIAQLHARGLYPYQWMFIFFGVFTVLLGIWILPDTPVSAGSLNERERLIAVERLRSNKTDVKNMHHKIPQIKEALMGLKVWMLVAAVFIHNIGPIRDVFLKHAALSLPPAPPPYHRHPRGCRQGRRYSALDGCSGHQRHRLLREQGHSHNLDGLRRPDVPDGVCRVPASTATYAPSPAFLLDFITVLAANGCDGLFGIDTIAKDAWSEMKIGDVSVVVPSNDGDRNPCDKFIAVAFAFDKDKPKCRVHGKCAKNHVHTSVPKPKPTPR